jgi:hypothetical protein
MSIRRNLAVAGALAAVAGCVAVPAANAAPNPGDSCSTPGTSADGSLWCDMQAGVWLSNPLSVKVTLGQPCSTPGDVSLARGGSGEDLARCGSGGVWVPWSR